MEPDPVATGRTGVLLSLVVPMYNEEKAIPVFLAALRPVLEKITEDYEIICVNDGSRDATLALLLREHRRDPRLKVVDLSRNFGKDIALTAGINYASGQAVIPMDADLQDPPEVIVEMVEKWRQGSEMVVAVRSERQTDTFLKRTTAKMFYRAVNRLSDTPITPNAGDFRLMDRAVVEALRLLPERTRFMKGLFAWLGFNQATVYYARRPRAAGTTKWRFWRLWNFALDGFVSFTSLPLKVWSYVGMATATMALGYMVYIIGKTLLYGRDVPGYASIVVLLLFFSGLNMIGLGILGEYVSRIFLEVKGRPLYLVRAVHGLSDPTKPAPGAGDACRG